MSWAWKYNTTPPVSPVTLEEAKAHLRVTHGDEDLLVISKLEGATRKCEEFCHRQLGQTQLVLQLDRLPLGRTPLAMPRPPLVSVQSLTYVDTAGAPQTFAIPNLIVDTMSEPGRLQPVFTSYWPPTQVQIAAVTIAFTAGYAAAAFPDLLRAAILLQLGSMFENREDVVVGTISNKLALGVEDLLMPFVVGDEFEQYGPQLEAHCYG
jgi:uncharacterized phiE125 gp8 family phage protein